jgi:aminoglycoside phosphotransferase (APT) family kinase protein
MTSPRPIHQALSLDRQHLAAFTECHYGGTLQAVRIRTLRGGLQAAGVFRVQAQLQSPTGQRRAVQFVVKLAHGEARRELAMYRALEAHAAEVLAPRLLGVAHAGATALLFLEWVAPVRAWPWREVHAAGRVLARLARLHQGCWGPGPEDAAWAYEEALSQSAHGTLEALQRVIRDRGAAPLQGAVPMTKRLIAALPEIRRALLAASPQAVWIHGDMHPGNVIMRRRASGAEPVLLDWARARPGSPLEDVSAWVQSLGHWEPQARRFHDTLVRTYLVARGLEPVMDRHFRRLYWMAGACNALAGALRYHVDALGQARTPAKQATAIILIQKWLRVIRRADASWRTG